jgi:hypothetical protein
VVVDESGALSPGMDIGRVFPEGNETGSRPELVIRKEPRLDTGIAFMGDGQRMVVDTEPERIRQFVIEENIDNKA